MSMRTGLRARVPVLAWAGLIFAFSAQPDLRFVEDRRLDRRASASRPCRQGMSTG